LAVVVQVQVRIAVVVVVADDHTKPKARIADAGLVRDVSELEAAIIPIERIAGGTSTRVPRRGAPFRK